MHKYVLLMTACIMFTGCAGLSAQRREAKTAGNALERASLSVGAAKQAGAASCAGAELKTAESELKLAEKDLGNKAYAGALKRANSADAKANEALKKCEASKRKKMEVKSKSK